MPHVPILNLVSKARFRFLVQLLHPRNGSDKVPEARERSRAGFQDLGVVKIPAVHDYYLGVVIVTILFVTGSYAPAYPSFTPLADADLPVTAERCIVYAHAANAAQVLPRMCTFLATCSAPLLDTIASLSSCRVIHECSFIVRCRLDKSVCSSIPSCPLYISRLHLVSAATSFTAG